MIFADSSALIALFNPNDDFHADALEWFQQTHPRLILTDYIIDEVLTLAISRGGKQFALSISKKIRDLIPAGVKKITEEDFYEAWKVFDNYQDKNWSFTDCVTYIFIKRSGIQKVFTFDTDFDQFGIVSRQPSS
jgi:predicted nucleic acid-binding protein